MFLFLAVISNHLYSLNGYFLCRIFCATITALIYFNPSLSSHISHFLLHCTAARVWLNVKVGPNEKSHVFVKFFFFFPPSDMYFVCLAPSSAAIKVFSSAFPRPHAAEELECCAIINLSNGVPLSRTASKGYFLFSGHRGGKKKTHTHTHTKQNKTKDRAGPLQSRIKES